MVDCTSGESGDISDIASLQGNALTVIDAWVEPPGSMNPLRCTRMEEEFFVRTPGGSRHDGKSKDYLLENNSGQRWVIPQAVFKAMFGA